jgi:hypothetical protein
VHLYPIGGYLSKKREGGTRERLATYTWGKKDKYRKEEDRKMERRPKNNCK